MKLFLIGMMGSGKSYWSSKLAKKLKCGAYDLDTLIETVEEKPIADIFAEDGEAYFRKAEAKVLRWFGEKKSFVLAVGGGTPCFHDNMEWMNKQGVTVWIDEPVDTLVQRLLPEKSHRPLIASLDDAQLQDFLLKKLEERYLHYSKTAYHLKDGEVNEHSFAKIIQEHA